MPITGSILLIQVPWGSFPHTTADDGIIQIWHLCECNINSYGTLKNDIAQCACAECNIIFQSAIKNDIARNQSAIYVLLYAFCSFKLTNLLILRIMKM